MSTNQYIPITKPEDYQLVYHTNQNGHIWLDAKKRPIPLTQTLTGHIDSTDPVLLWNSRVTREGYHSVPAAISKEVQLTALQLHNNLQNIQLPPVLFKILSQSHKG